jgi:hypothetical protein
MINTDKLVEMAYEHQRNAEVIADLAKQFRGNAAIRRELRQKRESAETSADICMAVAAHGALR